MTSRHDIDAMTEAPEREEAMERLIEAATHLLRNYLQDELDEPDLCVSHEHWSAIHDLSAALAQMESNDG